MNLDINTFKDYEETLEIVRLRRNDKVIAIKIICKVDIGVIKYQVILDDNRIYNFNSLEEAIDFFNDNV